MAKRTRNLRPVAAAPAKPVGRQPRPGIVHTKRLLARGALRGFEEGRLRETRQNP